MIAPLLSRCQVYLLEPLTQEDLEEILKERLHTFKSCSYPIKVEEKEALFHFSGGDARKLLNAVDLSVKLIQPTDGVLVLNNEKVAQSIQKTSHCTIKRVKTTMISSPPLSNRCGDQTQRRTLLAGAHVARRRRPAFYRPPHDYPGCGRYRQCESQCLAVGEQLFQAVHQIGMPEARIVLSQTVIYLASSPKSNAST